MKIEYQEKDFPNDLNGIIEQYQIEIADKIRTYGNCFINIYSTNNSGKGESDGSAFTGSFGQTDDENAKSLVYFTVNFF